MHSNSSNKPKNIQRRLWPLCFGARNKFTAILIGIFTYLQPSNTTNATGYCETLLNLRNTTSFLNWRWDWEGCSETAKSFKTLSIRHNKGTVGNILRWRCWQAYAQIWQMPQFKWLPSGKVTQDVSNVLVIKLFQYS